MKKLLTIGMVAMVCQAMASNVVNTPVCAPFGADTVVFLPFNDHANGTHLFREDAPASASYIYNLFTNSVSPGTYSMGMLLKTTGGLHVTNEAPGRYIFPSRNAKAPIAVHPAGIRHDGAVCLFMDGTTALLSKLSDYTIEFFCKLAPFGGSTRIALFYEPAPGNNVQRPVIYLPVNDGYRNVVRMQNGGTGNTGATQADVAYDDRSTIVDGQWHHFAIVYRSSWGGVRLYCDYTRVSGTVTTTPSSTDTAGQMRLGDYPNQFPGITSALRISRTALEPDSFMRASDDPSGAEESTAILYPFTEDSVGKVYANAAQSAAAVTTTTAFKGYADTQADPLNVIVYAKGTGSMRVTDDVPGQYLYSSLTALSPVASGLKSLRYGGDKSSANYGVIGLSGASTRIASMPRYTLEFFWKAHSYNGETTITYWDHAQPNVGDDRRFVCDLVGSYQQIVRFYSYTTTSGKSAVVDSTYYPHSLIDGKWHHLALVYDEDAGGLAAYCDYKSMNASRLPLARLPFSAADEWRLGSYNFDGSFSAVRVTRAALAPEQFLYASDSPDGPLPRKAVAWRLDGTAGGAVSAVVNSAERGTETNLYAFCRSDVAYGAGVTSGTVTYSANVDQPGAHRKECGVDGGRNIASAAVGGGGAIASDGYGPLVAHAYAFTAQAFVRVDSLPSAGTFATVVGRKDGTNGYAWCLALDATGQIVLKAKLTQDDGTCEDLTCATGVVLDSGWHHVAVTCDALARVFTVYRDYVPVGTATAWSHPLLLADGGLCAGGGCGLASLSGAVDEVGFIRDVLTPENFLYLKIAGIRVSFR